MESVDDRLHLEPLTRETGYRFYLALSKVKIRHHYCIYMFLISRALGASGSDSLSVKRL